MAVEIVLEMDNEDHYSGRLPDRARIFAAMRMIQLLPCLIPLLIACGGGSTTNAPSDELDSTMAANVRDTPDWTVDGTDSSRVRFLDGREFETGLYEMKFLGSVPKEGRAPYLILSGRYCTECDALLALYVHSPSDGPMKIENGEGALQHPGRLLDGETSEPYYSTRTFFGEVLPGVHGVVSYESVLDGGKGDWYTNLIDLSGAARRDTQYMDNSRLQQTLDLLAKGACREIPGMDQLSAP